ncbi:MAG: hypothetical protein Q7S92_03455 [Candidatus Diapherotrites archaeon]|nr:hypothetical protein [Candidatus Diapherotrites archaeon]
MKNSILGIVFILVLGCTQGVPDLGGSTQFNADTSDTVNGSADQTGNGTLTTSTVTVGELSVQKPGDTWITYSDEQQTVFQNINETNFIIVSENSEASIQDILTVIKNAANESNGEFVIQKEENIEVDGVTGKQIDVLFTVEPKILFKTVLVEKNGKTYKIGTSAPESDLAFWETFWKIFLQNAKLE